MRAVATSAVILSAILPTFACAELSDETLLGPGLRSRPAYDGSASQHVELVPVIRYLGEPWFARSTQGVLEGGLRTELAPGLHAAAQLAYEAGRKTSESALLTRLGAPSIGAGASLGAQLEWDHFFGPMPITLLLRGRQHLGTKRGAQADLRLSAGVFRSGRASAGLFAQTIWANADSATSLYGVGAHSGLLSTSVGALGSIELNRDWVIVGSMDLRRLHGDAARSPWVDKPANHSVSVGLAHRF